MNPRGIVFIVLAVLFAGGTVYVANSWLNAQRRPNTPAPVKTAEAPEAEVLVAKINLPAGTFIRPEHVRWQPWPKSGVAKVYTVRTGGSAASKKQVNAFVGAVVRKGIAIGEPITNGRVVKSGERGFMAAVLHPDMRAISVSVSATTAAAGFIFPGDRVDLLLTHTVKRGKKGRRASETLLTNMKVLATDQRTNDQAGKPSLSKTITLEVTPKQVEMINVARTLGRLSLSLRALPRADNAMAKAAEPPAKPDVKPDPAPKPAPKPELNVVAHDGPAPKRAGETPDTEGAQEGRPRSLAAEANPQKTASAQPPVAKAAPAPEAKTPATPVNMEDPIEPHRGKSMTWDSEVSRLLTGGLGPRVTVLRGRSVDVRAVKSGPTDGGGSTREKTSSSENSGKDPEEADGENAE